MFDSSTLRGLARPLRRALPALLLLAAGLPARADDGKMTLTLTPPLPGRLTYWFARDRQQTEPQTLEMPKSGTQIALSVPRAYCLPDASLAILDGDRKRIAHLPVSATLDGAAPRITEANLLFSPVWGVNAMPDADRAVIANQWRTWLRRRRIAQARRQNFPDGRTTPNVLKDGGFAAGLGHWSMENSKAPAHADAAVLTNPELPKGVKGRVIRCNVATAGTDSWHLQFMQPGINCEEGTPYTVSFLARADHARKIVVSASVDAPDWHLIGMYQTVNLSAEWKRYSLAFLPFQAKANHTRFSFSIADATGTVDFADVSLRAGVDFSGFAAMQAPEVALSQNDFRFSQLVQVPITAHGLGVAEGRVTLRNQDTVIGTYELQPTDGGAARFSDVPLNTPLKFTVSAGGKSQEFTRIVAEDKSNATQDIALPSGWEGVKTVAPAVIAAPPKASLEPAGGDKTLLWAALGITALALGGLGGYALLNRRPQPQSQAGLPQAITQQAPLNLSTLNPPLRFPESQAVGARRQGKALPEALPERTLDSAQLVAVAGKYSGAAFSLAGSSMVIGRDAGCDVPLPLDTSASRRHAEIRRYDDGIEITDNNSSNGTFINGVRLPANTSHALRPGDEIEIGASRFRYES